MDLLLKDTVLVLEAVAPRGVIESRHTVKETSSKTPETTVSKSCITLLFEDILQTEAQVLKSITGNRLDAKVEQGIIERAAYERRTEKSAQCARPYGWSASRASLVGHEADR